MAAWTCALPALDKLCPRRTQCPPALAVKVENTLETLPGNTSVVIEGPVCKWRSQSSMLLNSSCVTQTLRLPWKQNGFQSCTTIRPGLLNVRLRYKSISNFYSGLFQLLHTGTSEITTHIFCFHRFPLEIISV